MTKTFLTFETKPQRLLSSFFKVVIINFFALKSFTYLDIGNVFAIIYIIWISFFLQIILYSQK